ncbi:hypothetical protein [Janibacter alittae]|uniref:Uncharacterized protein n=1 Tax=Janibacter alittae TaxID=3115209 RepID=A0ABZ2MLD1_9MICO
MMVLRGVLVVTGVVVALVGLVDLIDEGWGDVGHTVVWLVAGVVTHDALLSGAVILLGWGVVRTLPSYARAPTVVGLVVLATVTVAVLPTVTVTWTDPSNVSLLDRNYARNWFGFVVVVLVGVLAGSAWARLRSPHRRADSAGSGGGRGGRHPRR